MHDGSSLHQFQHSEGSYNGYSHCKPSVGYCEEPAGRDCMCISAELDRMKIPYILENPATLEGMATSSYSSSHVKALGEGSASRLLAVQNAMATADCFHDSPHIPDDDLHRLTHTCAGKTGICSRTGKPHFQLTGSQGGVPWTKIAEAYPKLLRDSLAYALLALHHTLP